MSCAGNHAQVVHKPNTLRVCTKMSVNDSCRFCSLNLIYQGKIAHCKSTTDLQQQLKLAHDFIVIVLRHALCSLIGRRWGGLSKSTPLRPGRDFTSYVTRYGRACVRIAVTRDGCACEKGFVFSVYGLVITVLMIFLMEKWSFISIIFVQWTHKPVC